MNVSVSVDPRNPAEFDAAISELHALKNRWLGIHAVEETTGMESLGTPDLTKVHDAPVHDAATQALDDLWPRLGRRLRQLMKAAAAFSAPYTTADLAAALNTDPKTAKSWRANLGRSLNAVAKNVPSAPRFFEEHPQPGGGWHYSIHPAYREAIAERDLLEPNTDGTVPKPE
jgi:hypothetical protein